MSPAGKGGKLPPFLLPFLFPARHSDSPSSGLEWLSGLASSLPFFADLSLETSEMPAPSSEGLTPLLPLIDIPVKIAPIGMTQMALAEENTQEWGQNAAQW